ncbi:MAG: CRISPR-associated endonuclease Cas2 [Chloroflexi bacterium]|nr:CRISPR-associated endonuclease Cas2 [Chloroflexota bacterium]
MRCLLIYDITDDGLRTKIADICLDYGLKRIQYSAFFGELSQNRQGEILQKMKRRIGKREANVQLFPICERDVGLCKQIIVTWEPDRTRDRSTDGTPIRSAER